MFQLVTCCTANYWTEHSLKTLCYLLYVQQTTCCKQCRWQTCRTNDSSLLPLQTPGLYHRISSDYHCRHDDLPSQTHNATNFFPRVNKQTHTRTSTHAHTDTHTHTHTHTHTQTHTHTHTHAQTHTWCTSEISLYECV